MFRTIISRLKKFNLSLLFVFLGIFGFSIFLFKSLSLKKDTKGAKYIIGDQARSFLIEDFSTKNDFLKQYSNNGYIDSKKILSTPHVINFWASWCLTCREESYLIEKAWNKYKDKGVLFLGVAIQDDRLQLKKAVAKLSKTYLVGLDHTGNMSIDYGLTGVPETFFISSEGNIVYKHIGPLSEKVLYKNIDEMLPSTISMAISEK